MPALLVRHDHSRFQLRTPTRFTTVFGYAIAALGAVGTLTSLGAMLGGVKGLLCPLLLAIGLVIIGGRFATSGALLLESIGGELYVGANDRTVPAGRLGPLTVRWRQAPTGTLPELRLALTEQGKEGEFLVCDEWLTHPDPAALARQLGAQLAVEAKLEQVPF
jgi:hypothetical protein